MLAREARAPIRSNSVRAVNTINRENIVKHFDKLSTCRRIITPRFERFRSRYSEGQVLPCFMQNINTRTSLTTLSFEMLKASNCIQDSRSLPASARRSRTRKARYAPTCKSVGHNSIQLSYMFLGPSLTSKECSPAGKTMSNVDFTFKINTLS